MKITDSLIVIPARGGSRGLPGKNILPLAGRPLICYTIDAARGVTSDDNICMSSDDPEIIKITEDYGLNVNFIRPSILATDFATSEDVIIHALDFYLNKFEREYSKIILLQPTSPLRNSSHILEAYSEWDDKLDMVVSVRESPSNPYFNLFEEDRNGYLRKSKKCNLTRRQDCPNIYEFNGAIYIINTTSLRSSSIRMFSRIKKKVMDELSSIEIDKEHDLLFAEYIHKSTSLLNSRK
jgi:CMP-N,N'-diacetyllegionaminic acid synthase